MIFSGSYQPEDVTFLLKSVQLEPTDVVAKERLIQSGQRHYSEMIGAERLPSPAYMRVFEAALEREKARLARDVLVLARRIAMVRPGAINVVSLARAGTPIGILVGRTLRLILNRPARHYSVSIIRDRGIDETALRHIIDSASGGRKPPDAHLLPDSPSTGGLRLRLAGAESIVFVDGWTGKGVIARELCRAIRSFNAREGLTVDGGLYTLADLCGEAAFAASADDYLIPSSVLGATVSGLISRSILNDTVIGPDDFHGCLYLEEFAPYDQSRRFVDEVFAEIERQAGLPLSADGVTARQRAQLRTTSETFLALMRQRFRVRDVNHIKPGVGEATRVLLRRVPQCVLVRDAGAAAVAHLLLLAREKNTPVIVDPALAYTAAAIIKELNG